MNADSSIGLLAVFTLVLINAFLSAAHAALVNVRKAALRELAEKGDKRAQRVLDVSEDATRLITSRQFVGNLLRFFAAGILTLVIGEPAIAAMTSLGVPIERARLIGYPAVWIFGAVIMLIFGEMIPTAIATARPDGIAMWTVDIMAVLLQVLRPVTRLTVWISNGFVTLVGGQQDVPYVTEEEIMTLVDAGSEEGVIENDEKEMIYSIFQFNDTVAREIMVPRIDVVGLDADATLEQALDVAIKEGHSRIPVYEGTIDRIIGLLYAKDLLRLWREDQSKERKAREIVRPAYFVPESKKAGALLEELQERKIQIAIVVDEYGGTAGLITIEDLVEEIVGEIQDEYDPEEEADYVKISDDEYLFDAGINLNDVNDLLDVELDNEESDTLGGYVLHMLDRVPLGGESFEDNGLMIKVELVTGRRVRKVRVSRIPKPVEAESGQENGKTELKTDDKPVETLPGETGKLKPDTV
jgi:putative hemolysin